MPSLVGCSVLFTHHGRRLSQRTVRDELDRAAGLDHITPHQLRQFQRRSLVTGTDGAAGPHVRRDEPALRATVRHNRPRRIRTRPQPGQTTGLHACHRQDQPAPDRPAKRRGAPTAPRGGCARKADHRGRGQRHQGDDTQPSQGAHPEEHGDHWVPAPLRCGRSQGQDAVDCRGVRRCGGRRRRSTPTLPAACRRGPA